MKIVYFLLCCVGFISCKQKNKATTEQNKTESAADPHSFAEPGKVVVKHLDLHIELNFDKKTLSGKAVWTIENRNHHDEITLDTRQLNIKKITLDDSKEEAMFALGDEEKYLGKPLSIQIKPDTKKITIWYSTSPQAAALQWLNAQQTAGKKFPFLFTQSQAILARTWIPCQDSPGIRFTYNATVTVPKELLALMSAKNPKEKNAHGKYEFHQPNPIPSYLMALAVGDISFKAIDSRTGIYAEPTILPKAVYEFADMGKMVTEAEKLYGTYKWGRYDVLVLPPSFPFGGMENPMLTFATPTIIAGDRSLVSLIAHELAHSWSGNLVTNANWNDFWLNEGFTTYFERRIVEAVYGKEEAKMQEVLGYQGLQETVDEIGKTNADTRLKVDFAGRDPDEGVTDIAYEKGYFFLRTIEEAVGREKMDVFLKSYFNDYAFQSLTTEQFLTILENKLLKANPDAAKKVNIDEWVYKSGIPSNIPAVGSAAFQKIDQILSQYQKTKEVKELKGQLTSSNQKLYFLSHLPANLTTSEMSLLDKEFNLTKSGNAEIQASWYALAIRNKYKASYPEIENFLIQVGRRKFLLPLYKELVKTPEGKSWANEIYAKAKLNYHSVSAGSVEEILKGDK